MHWLRLFTTYRAPSSSLSYLKTVTTTSTARCRRYHRHVPQPPSTQVAELLAKHTPLTSIPPLNLSTLLSFAQPLTPESVIASGRYVLLELPRRLATRVRSLEALPFIVGTNPYVAKILDAFRASFLWIATYPPINDLAENAKFAGKLEDLLRRHAHDIPIMAKG
jgi:26S proteasome regulatory subunit T1